MPVITLYQGRTKKASNFDVEFTGGKDAHNLEGPGFYLTDSREDALRYTGRGGVVLTCQINTNGLITEKSRTDFDKAYKLIDLAPELDDILTDWDESPTKARIKLQQSLITHKAKETFLNIWYDCYHRSGDNKQYVLNMIKLGVKGFVVKRDQVMHYILFNPKSIKVLETHNYKEELAAKTPASRRSQTGPTYKKKLPSALIKQLGQYAEWWETWTREQHPNKRYNVQEALERQVVDVTKRVLDIYTDEGIVPAKRYMQKLLDDLLYKMLL